MKRLLLLLLVVMMRGDDRDLERRDQECSLDKDRIEIARATDSKMTRLVYAIIRLVSCRVSSLRS